jgi:septum formation protein
MRRVVLASASPRRLALLAQIGVVPDAVIATEVDETPLPKESPRALARRLACAKAEAAREPDAMVLGADTIVALGRRLFGKPNDEDDARRFLQLLSGRNHRVVTGVALKSRGVMRSRLVETRVSFKVLSPPEIDAYIASDEWRGKAGGYAIQGRAARFVTGIVGSYSNIVGLPLCETANLLEGGP